MKIIYIAGPYRGATINETRENIRAAEARAVDVVRAGHYPIVPHSCTAFMDGLAPDAQFLAGSLEAMSRCDEVWLVEGWESSRGTIIEIARAFELGKPVYDETGAPLLGSEEMADESPEWASGATP